MSVYWIPLAALLVIALAHVVTAIYCAELFTRSKRRRVEGTPGDLGLRYDDVQFPARDGTMLRGWYLESPGARGTVVLVHDVDGTRSDRTRGLHLLQRDYLRRGFHVLAFDLRGRGESGGSRDHFGSLERQDVAAAIEFARGRAPRLPLIAHGFGLGASLSLAATAEQLPIDVVIADSPFSSARAYLRRRWPALPGPTFRLALRLARRLFEADADALSPLRAMGVAPPVPILLIHGETDRLVPVAHSLNIAAAALHGRAEVWCVPSISHCAGYTRAPDAYLRRCFAFIDAALPARRISVAAAG